MAIRKRHGQVISLGLIGCGYISAKHLPAIAGHRSFRLAAVADNDKARAEATAKQYDCRSYISYQKLLKDEAIKAVVICTPSGLHPSIVEAAARSGKDIICEKPLALNLTDARKAVRLCRQKNVKLLVVHQNRFQPVVQAVKKAIEDKAFGTLVSLSIGLYWNRGKDYYAQSSWRGTWKMDGGVLLNQANHHLDLLRFLGGRVRSVFARVSRRTHPDIQVDDQASALIEFTDGAHGVFNATTSVYPANLEDTLTVIGEKGTVKISSVVNNRLDVLSFDNYRPDLARLEREITEVSGNQFAAFSRFYSYAAGILNSSTYSDFSLKEQLGTLELIMACYLSAKTGKKVSLPLKQKVKLEGWKL